MANTIFMNGLVVAAYSNHRTDEAVSPGHLLELGGTNDVQKLTAAGNYRRAVALENSVGGSMTTAYASGDTVNYAVFAPGSRVRLRVRGGATNITKNATLTAHSDGTVKGGSSGIIGIALEALNNNSSSTEAFIEVELV